MGKKSKRKKIKGKMNMGNGIWIGTLKLQGSIHSPIDKEDQQLALALALDIITTSPPLID